MNSNRRGIHRKNRGNVNKDGGNQSISYFTQKRSREVEIIDEDEDQFAFNDPTPPSRPLSLRRKKKPIILDKSDEEDNTSNDPKDMINMDEDEELKEAMRQSRLELEKEAKQREMYSKFGTSDLGSDEEMPTAYEADIPSSTTSSGIEPLDRERTESPELFGTPQSSKDKIYNCQSPKNVECCNTTKSHFDKEINIKLTPIKKNFFQKKEKEFNEEESISDTNRERDNSPINETKKRKHLIEDDSEDESYDGAKEFLTKSIPAESRKKQKTIEDDFTVSSSKIQQETTVKSETKQFVIEDDEDDESSQDQTENAKKRADSSKLKKYFKVRLERKYKKPKLPIRNIRDAMKARLFFAPPGIDHKLYTYAIMKMLDHTKECIRKAQQRSLKFVKWGLPAVAGPRVGDTLDAPKKENNKRKSNPMMTVEEPSRRNLRSSTQSKFSTSTTTVKTEPPKTTNLEQNSKNGSHSDSDSSDEGLTKSVFASSGTEGPKDWREYNIRSGGQTFGENINTSNHSKESNSKEGKKNLNKAELRSFVENEGHDVIVEKKKTPQKEGTIDLVQQENKKDCSTNSSPTVSTESNKASTSCENLQTEGITDQRASKSFEDTYKQQTQQQKDFPSRSDYRYPQKQMETLQEEDDDGIDSSGEIGKRKKRHGKNVPVINDEEEVNSTCQDADVEMIDIHEYSCSDSSKATKPGELLTNTAGTSGFLSVKRNSDNPLGVQRKVSSAAKKAAEAAEKRSRQSNATTASNSPEISSSVDSSQTEIPSKESLVECPICYGQFPLKDIENHAATCNGTPPCSKDEDYSSRGGQSDQRSIASSSTDPTLFHNEEYGLKKLKVVVTNSPEAQHKLKDQRGVLSTSSTKRKLSLSRHKKSGSRVVDKRDSYLNMDLNQEDSSKKDDVSDTEFDSQALSQKFTGLKSFQVVITKSPEAQRRVKEQTDVPRAKRNLTLSKCEKPEQITNVRKVTGYIDMTEEQDDFPREDTSRKEDDDSSQSRDGSQKNSQTFMWWTSKSAAKLKKDKFKITYGNKKKTVTNKNPFPTLDFIPLEEKQPSSESEDDATEKPSAMDRTEDSSLRYATTGALQDPSTLLTKATTSIDCDSDSDICNLNGAQKFPKSCKATNIFRTQKQLVTSKNKKKNTKDDFNEDDYANEMALMELAGINEKRPRPENNNKRSKRRKRATISSDESDDSDDCEKCYMCGQRVLKEIYQEHTESCMEKNPASSCTTTGDNHSSKSSIRKSPRRKPKPTTSSNTVEMDSDEIGNSPIKSFKLIGDEDRSIVDFDNQFAFFGKSSKNTSSSKRGTKVGRDRGRGRGKRFRKKPWYKKSYKN